MFESGYTTTLIINSTAEADDGWAGVTNTKTALVAAWRCRWMAIAEIGIGSRVGTWLKAQTEGLAADAQFVAQGVYKAEIADGMIATNSGEDYRILKVVDSQRASGMGNRGTLLFLRKLDAGN